jgi:hypothetical protein
VLECHNRIEAQAEDSGLLDVRMPFTFERVVVPLFQGTMRADNREAWLGFFRFGVGAGLYSLWQDRMAELGVAAEQQYRDWVVVESENDRLSELELPVVIHGCELRRHPLTGYELRSKGPLGGGNVTSFHSEGPLADIFGVAKAGKLGTRPVKVPIERHVQALRELGFTEVRFPNGKHYELRAWPGLKRIS